MTEETMPLSKEDCGAPMSEEESRQVQIAMLDALDAYCAQNGLHYFLSGGTLLGAIRHHGFIPWDDDIDVNMPRPDCERLMEQTGGRLGPYRLEGPDEGKYRNNCNYFRLYDDATVVENFRGGLAQDHPDYHPIFIDIFPIEGLPKEEERCNRHWNRTIYLAKMRRASALQAVRGKTRAATAFHVIGAIPARIVGYRRWGRRIQKCAKAYDFDKEDYVGVTTTTHYLKQEKVEKEKYMEPVKVDFEGKQYNAPGNYDTYLRQLFGDYMAMPPVEQQQSHHTFRMYWRAQTQHDG